ncbi:MAG: TetR/AcrR family transcriptional regulator [Desulfosporosinus sp.]|nr:TetR/AcrR family transcriptional regulator [Desulfosporosinus sp.]
MTEKPLGNECAATRQRLMAVALEEFLQAGYKGTSTRAITEKAGVNEVTLFRHFGSKQGLLKAAALNAVELPRVAKDIEYYLKLPLREGLTQLTSDYAEQLAKVSDLFTLGLAESFAHPEIAEVLKTLMWELRSKLIDYFEKLAAQHQLQALDSQVLAHIVLAAFYAVSVIRRRAPQDVTKHLTDERILRALVEMIVSTYGTVPC